MREKCDQYAEKYNLNFNLVATPAGNLTSELIQMDQAIYGKLKEVTDKKIYTDSFHIPINFKIEPKKKIEIEAPYHELTNGGHITEINLEYTPTKKEFMELLDFMKKENIGYGTIYKSLVDN